MKKENIRKEITGKIDISVLNVPPEKHEFDTAKFFAKMGYDVEFIKPRHIRGQKIQILACVARCGRRKAL